MIRRFVTRLIACLMLSIVCSGCITAAVVGLVALGCVAIAGSGKSGGGNESNAEDERYLFTSVDSGVASAQTCLSYRYRVVASRVYFMASNRHFNSDYLNSLMRESWAEPLFPELDAMYPGVFFCGSDAIPVVAEMRIIEVYAHERAKYHTSLKAEVVVKDAHTGAVFGKDGFREEFGWVDAGATNAPIQTCEYQTFHGEDEIGASDTIFEQAIFEGYAGAIVACLDKFENGNDRKPIAGTGARFVRVVKQEQQGGQQYDDTGVDNTAAAVNFFMGSMGAINSMNQANRARSHARHVQRMGEINARRMNAGGRNLAGSQSSMSSGQDASPQLPRVCPMCGGSGKCRPCNGNGRIASVDAIASGKSSDYHIINSGPSATAVMAQSRGGCGPCGGTGKCRGCNGSGRR